MPFATAEDLIIHKLFAGRATDLEDAAAVVRRKGRSLDWDYVDAWVRQFADVPGREGLLGQLDELRKQGKESQG